MSVAIIINPLSGGASPAKGRRRAELAAAALATCGEDGDIFVTERRGSRARAGGGRRATRGARLVIAWGGDGTVNEVASALVFGSTALGIVPSGSGNGLARELGVEPPARAGDRRGARAPRRVDRRRRARRPAVLQPRGLGLRRAHRRLLRSRSQRPARPVDLRAADRAARCFGYQAANVLASTGSASIARCS